MLSNLRIDKPLVFIDVETTGLNPYSDRIVELAMLRVRPDGIREFRSDMFDPGIPIPPDATAVHGITDQDVAGKSAFARHAVDICGFLEGCDIAGFNIIRFDLPFLEAEFARAGVGFSRQGRCLIDSQIIYHLREPRDLQAAYRKYCGGEMAKAHRAEEDVRAAAEILNGQLAAYTDLPRDVTGLGAVCSEGRECAVDAEGKFVWANGEAVCSFGKHKGRSLREIAKHYPDYLEWILRGDFSAEVKGIATRALNGEFPEPPESVKRLL